LLEIFFVLAPAMLAYKYIRTPNQVILPLLIVAWKLTQLAPCPCTGLNWEPRAIYRTWFVLLLAILALRWRQPEQTAGTGLNPA